MRSRSGRHPDRNHVEPVVEVLAERSFLHRLLQVDVGRGNQPEVGLDRVRAADALDLALLDGAQQLRLQLVPQVADLVEEQRAAAGQLELAELLADGAGERALLVPEQRALDQLLRNRGQVDGDERRARAGPTRDGSAAPAAPCRCRSRRGSAPWPTASPPSGPARRSRACRGSARRRTRGRSARRLRRSAAATSRFRSCRSLALATSVRTPSASKSFEM